MPNTESAKKRVRQSEKRRVRNRAVRSSVRTIIGKARREVDTHQPESDAAVREALRALDVAARKGVLHPNNAARRKSRLMKRLNANVATA